MTTSLEVPAPDPSEVVLRRLHARARRDWWHMLVVLPRAVAAKAMGRSLMASIRPSHLRHAFIPVSREEGELLRFLAVSRRARTIVEFRLVMRGASLTEVKELLGHSTIQMTMRCAHLSPSARRAAVALLDEPQPRQHDGNEAGRRSRTAQ